MVHKNTLFTVLTNSKNESAPRLSSAVILGGTVSPLRVCLDLRHRRLRALRCRTSKGFCQLRLRCCERKVITVHNRAHARHRMTEYRRCRPVADQPVGHQFFGVIALPSGRRLSHSAQPSLQFGMVPELFEFHRQFNPFLLITSRVEVSFHDVVALFAPLLTDHCPCEQPMPSLPPTVASPGTSILSSPHVSVKKTSRHESTSHDLVTLIFILHAVNRLYWPSVPCPFSISLRVPRAKLA